MKNSSKFWKNDLQRVFSFKKKPDYLKLDTITKLIEYLISSFLTHLNFLIRDAETEVSKYRLSQSANQYTVQYFQTSVSTSKFERIWFLKPACFQRKSSKRLSSFTLTDVDRWF